MKVINRFFEFLDSLTDIGALLIFIVLLLIGVYSIYDSYMIVKGATDDSILKFKPGYETDEKSDKQILSSMVAWLTVDDTDMDFPVMQGRDNMEFLNKDAFGDYSLSGSIFLDYRNKKDFSDFYNLIYGHHMEGGMFGALDKYYEEDYFKEHTSGSLIVGEDIYDLSLFALVYTEATDKNLFSIPSDIDVKQDISGDVFNYIKENAKLFDEEVVRKYKSNKLLSLSTCRYPDTTDRTIVVGFLHNKRALKNVN